MKFKTNNSFNIKLEEELSRFEGRTYVQLSETVPEVTRRQAVGMVLARAGYYKFQLKLRGNPVWVWCLDKSVQVPDTNEARRELELHPVTRPVT